MFKAFEKENPGTKIKLSTYKKVYNRYNIGWFKPKNDLCTTCTAYENSEKSPQEIKEYYEHRKNVELLQESVGTNSQGNNNVRLASRDSIRQTCTHMNRIPRKSRLLSASFLNIRSFNYSKFAYLNFSTSCLLIIYNSFTYYLKQIGLG